MNLPFGKHLLNLNSPLGNKILIKSVKYRKNLPLCLHWKDLNR